MPSQRRQAEQRTVAREREDRPPRRPATPATELLQLQRHAGNQAVTRLVQQRQAAVARLVVTGRDPESDPMTAACVPFAIKEAQGPAVKFARGIDYRPHKSVIYMGHGKPGGELSDFNARELIDEVTNRGRGMTGGSTLMLWSCFAGRPTPVSPSLVSQVADGFGMLGITGVTVTGVKGGMFTNTADEKLYSGPDPDSPAKHDVAAVQAHCWATSGLGKPPFTPYTLVSAAGTFPLTIGKAPRSIGEAIEALVANGKLPMAPPAHEDKKRAIQEAMRRLYADLFAHRVVQYHLEKGNMSPAVPPALVTATSALLAATDTAESRDPDYEAYMRDRRALATGDQSEI